MTDDSKFDGELLSDGRYGPVWLEFVKDMAVILTPIALAFIGYMQVAAQAEVREVKEDLASIEKTGEEVHSLSNSAFAGQLELNALLSRELANFTKTEAHRAAADVAEKRYAEHQATQKQIDENNREPKP